MKLQKSVFLFSIVLACGVFFVGVTTVFAAEIDTDSDGLNDVEERTIYFTDYLNPDTDGDGYNDGLEIQYGYSPRHGGDKKLVEVDSDKDHLNDSWELKLGTGLLDPDSDNDLYLDGTEVAASYHPLDAESVKMEKLIAVDLTKQELTYSMDGIVLENFTISSGLPATPTPTGEFMVLDKVPSKTFGGNGFGFYYPNTKWNLHFTTDYWRYYIHGVYWHDNFGQPMSSGCVNVDYDRMERLYWWAQYGTKVAIH